MNLSVLTTLEYHKIRAMLANKTGSVMGREMAEALLPIGDFAEVERRIAETKEAREILDIVPNVPLGGIRDIRGLVKRAEVGSILDPTDLVAVNSTLYAARRLKSFFAELDIPSEILRSIAENITSLKAVENIIENTVDEQGNIRDDASAELMKIRREIKISQSRIKDKLDNLLRSAEYNKYFQDNIVTMRGDRYVIPVKQEYRHNFPGIVHDQSASGATVFIEPIAVVNLNNDIKQLISAEKNEVERILRLVTNQIAKYAEVITINAKALAHLDFAFAKARISYDMNASVPIINNNGYVNLRQARHPLIDKAVVVPIDIYIGKDFNILLITGPNTGGKTVTLKTLGLFALMTQAGLFIPAQSGSEIAVFQNIFADIGDEQSIEQSLSTFSAHMTNLVNILGEVTADDLVLIDEIGAGTDPDEGAALAMAMLEYLLNIGVRTIATTHYSELKTFAYSRHGIENASVEFDIKTLKPTHKLLIGIPGSSNAFSISKRLGLSEQIIEQAKSFIAKEHLEFEKVLTGLEQEKILYTKLHDELKDQQQDLARLQKKLVDDEHNLSDKKNKILLKAQEEAAALIRQTKREAEIVIKELKAQFAVQNGTERQKSIDNSRKRLNKSISNLNKVEIEDDLPTVSIDKLKLGMNIYVTTLKQTGTILAIGTNEVTVQVGIMKINVPIENCRVDINNTKRNRELAKSGMRNVAKTAPVSSISRQVDIRGITVEEAEYILAKYLDDAILAGLSEVLVIHGKGTGALRKGVRAYLKQHQHVRDISIAELNEGGDGATVVRLL